MANKTSQHILSTLANLLGICLFILTSLHLTNKNTNSLLDEFTVGIALFLTISCILSFISIKMKDEEMEYKLEQIDDYFFLLALLGILVIILFFITTYFNLVKVKLPQ